MLKELGVLTEIATEIEIAASPERVWQVLTDFPAYPQWNPFMHLVNGELRAGGCLKARVLYRHGLRLSFRALVLRAEPARELRWQGVLLFSGLFQGEHSFVIQPLGEGRVRFTQHETYTGVLAPLLMAFLKERNRRGFEEMNRALQARAEKA